MKNPEINRAIGYVMLFLGFIIFYRGFHATTESGLDIISIGVSIIIIITSFVWMILKVRCPHCNGLLNIKLGNISTCPHCGKSTR